MRDLRALPKAHLHLHLEGAMRRSTFEELAEGAGLPVPAVRSGAGFAGFMDLYLGACAVLRGRDHLQRLVTEVAEDAAVDGAVWVEVHFDTTLSGDTEATSEDLEVFLELAGEATSATGIGLGLVMAADRTLDPSVAVLQARCAAEYSGRGVVAFGLVNDETNHPPEPFAEAFAIAREAGLISAPHAGELAGARSVRAALDALRAQRIGHGVTAVDDPALLGRLAEEGVCCDVCPTSNVSMGLYGCVEDHPVAAMLHAGVRVSLNADNPLLTGNGLLDEYELVRATFHLSDEEMAGIARTSITASGMPDNAKAAALRGIETWLRSPGPPPQSG